METPYTCQYCGKDTSEVEYDYLSGTDHLSCTLEKEQKQRYVKMEYGPGDAVIDRPPYKNNPIEKCVICGAETAYRFNDHIDYRFNYVEGAGQLCVKCGGSKEISETFAEVEPLGTSNPIHMLILVDETTILYTPNDAELGAKVRKIYWDLKQEKNK
jgi:hypothetical protein